MKKNDYQPPIPRNVALDRLFTGCDNPVLIQSLELAVRNRQPITVTRVPVSLLLPLFLLAEVAREYEAEPLVDEFVMLRETVRIEFEQTPPRFWHPEQFLASAAIFQEAKIVGGRDADYIVNAFKELTGAFNGWEEDRARANRKKK